MKETQEKKLEWLRREIQKGVDDLKAGRFCDDPETMAKIREKLLKLKAQRDKKEQSIR